MHQGTSYRYASWQPVQTVNETMGTKAPYYGNITVATFLGDLTKDNVSISDIEQGSIYENVYAAYMDGRLERIAVIQMMLTIIQTRRDLVRARGTISSFLTTVA